MLDSFAAIEYSLTMSEHQISSALLWRTMRRESHQASIEQPSMANFFFASILDHRDFATAISRYLASKLQSADMSAAVIYEIFWQVISSRPSIVEKMLRDLSAYRQRDPVCSRYITPFLYFKGYHSLQTYRVAHCLWRQGRTLLASYLQSKTMTIFDVDIHPAATLGSGIMLDHATGIVIGETVVIEDDVSILHNVTLGGSGADREDRHPKVRRGVLLSTGAKIIGNIEIGEGAKVGAGSLVLAPVPAHTTVAGVPAKIIGKLKSPMPALDMNHQIEENGQGIDA